MDIIAEHYHRPVKLYEGPDYTVIAVRLATANYELVELYVEMHIDGDRRRRGIIEIYNDAYVLPEYDTSIKWMRNPFVQPMTTNMPPALVIKYDWNGAPFSPQDFYYSTGKHVSEYIVDVYRTLHQQRSFLRWPIEQYIILFDGRPMRANFEEYWHDKMISQIDRLVDELFDTVWYQPWPAEPILIQSESNALRRWWPELADQPSQSPRAPFKTPVQFADLEISFKHTE